MSDRLIARLPWALLTLAVVLVLAMVALSLGREELFDTVFYGVRVLALATTGAFVAARHPANPIGWIFCGLGAWGGVVETWQAFAYRELPTAELGAWVTGWSWVVDMSAYVVVFLLFPSGRLLSRRWRLVLWVLAAALVLGVPGQALNPDNPDNPLKVDSVVLEVMFGVGMLLLMTSFVAAVVSIVLRYRAAVGVERQQLKQLVFAGSLALPIMALAVPLFGYDSLAVRVALAVAFLSLPVAAGIAILRYRLYDIDVVINRALVYGALTATLAGSYLGAVLLLQLALSPVTESSSLAIAASTLAVAALFRPVRKRIQSLVDRRFFRTRYDAALTLERFGAHLRDEVDLETLGDDLRAVVAETMQPAHVTLWLRAPAGR
jgi:hypothetical protein